MKLTCKEFDNNETMPKSLTCSGGDQPPTLQVEGVPASAKSLLLIMHDPNAVNGEFLHWLVYNIDPKKPDFLGSNQGVNNFGKPGYGGPCPTKGTGDHHYVFDLYALSAKFDALPKFKSAAEVLTFVHAKVLDSATLIGVCSHS